MSNTKPPFRTGEHFDLVMRDGPEHEHQTVKQESEPEDPSDAGDQQLLTCFFWHHNGHCNKLGHQCKFAHFDTGKVANHPSNTIKIERARQEVRPPATMQNAGTPITPWELTRRREEEVSAREAQLSAREEYLKTREEAIRAREEEMHRQETHMAARWIELSKREHICHARNLENDPNARQQRQASELKFLGSLQNAVQQIRRASWNARRVLTRRREAIIGFETTSPIHNPDPADKFCASEGVDGALGALAGLTLDLDKIETELKQATEGDPTHPTYGSIQQA